jgi:hypothetical protein
MAGSTASPGGGGVVLPAGSGGGSAIGAGSRIPVPLSSLQQYNPNRADQVEGIWQPFYHSQTYLAAGQASLQFFNVAFTGNYTVTNMPAAAFFPAPTAFLVRALMLNFIPGNPTNTSAAAPTLAQTNNIADVIAVANAGYVEFVIGGKVYLRDSPSGRFGPNYGISAVAALGGTLTAPALTSVAYARAASRYYEITPFLIPQTQNFSVTLYTPTLVPVSVAGSMIATMDGFYYRQSQ